MIAWLKRWWAAYRIKRRCAWYRICPIHETPLEYDGAGNDCPRCFREYLTIEQVRTKKLIDDLRRWKETQQ